MKTYVVRVYSNGEQQHLEVPFDLYDDAVEEKVRCENVDYWNWCYEKGWTPKLYELEDFIENKLASKLDPWKAIQRITK